MENQPTNMAIFACILNGEQLTFDGMTYSLDYDEAIIEAMSKLDKALAENPSMEITHFYSEFKPEDVMAKDIMEKYRQFLFDLEYSFLKGQEKEHLGALEEKGVLSTSKSTIPPRHSVYEKPDSFFSFKKKKILKRFDKHIKSVLPVIKNTYGDEFFSKTSHTKNLGGGLFMCFAIVYQNSSGKIVIDYLLKTDIELESNIDILISKVEDNLSWLGIYTEILTDKTTKEKMVKITSENGFVTCALNNLDFIRESSKASEIQELQIAVISSSEIYLLSKSGNFQSGLMELAESAVSMQYQDPLNITPSIYELENNKFVLVKSYSTD